MKLNSYSFFTSLFDFIRHYKAGRKDTMYYELVKKETGFIFNTICKRLYREIPDINLLTCHDQIYFEARFMPLVRPIWDEEIGKILARIPVVPELQLDDTDLENLGIVIDYG